MKLYELMENPKLAGAAPALGVQTAMDQHTASPIGSGTSKWEAKKRAVTMMGAGGPQKVKMNEVRDVQLDEISNKILGDYKKAAGADASAADKAGDFKRGDKRFKGIVRATVKQGDNDAKKHKEQGVAEAAGSREKFTDLKSWAAAAKQQGLRVGPANGDIDYDYSYWAVGKGGEVFGKFVTTRVPQNNHGYIKKQGVAEDDTHQIKGNELIEYLMKRFEMTREQAIELLKKKGLAEDDDAIAAFLARGGEVQKLKPAKPRKGEGWQGSSHIGSASGRGNTKGRVSGLGANTGKTAKPVVATESLGRATPKMPKARDPGHAVLAAKRSSGAAGQHTNKKRQAILQPKHQKPLTRDMDLGEGWKSALGGAALAGAVALGGGAAHAQSAPSGADQLPSIVAHITFKVGDQTVTKDFNLGTKFNSPGQASAAVEKLMKDKGIKYANWSLERVEGGAADAADASYLDSAPASAAQGNNTNYADNTPYKTSGKSSGDYMAKEDLEESIERRLMQMRRAGYDIT